MTQEQKDKLIYGEPVEHDMAACNALREYERLCKPGDELRELKKKGILSEMPSHYPDMQAIAKNYGTTIEAMKEHWQCIE
jgi:hypothetical protein